MRRTRLTSGLGHRCANRSCAAGKTGLTKLWHWRRFVLDLGLELGDLLADLLANLRRGLGDFVLRGRCRVHHRLAVLLPPVAHLLAPPSTVIGIEEVDERSSDRRAHQHPGTKHEVILL